MKQLLAIATIAMILAAALAVAGPVTVAWDRPRANTDDTEIPADAPLTYVVMTGPATGVYDQTNEVDAAQIEIEAPANAVRYTRVIARNALGMASDPTPELMWVAGTAPNAPEGLRVPGAVQIVNQQGVVHVYIQQKEAQE